jgi:hypothetical protein
MTLKGTLEQPIMLTTRVTPSMKFSTQALGFSGMWTQLALSNMRIGSSMKIRKHEGVEFKALSGMKRGKSGFPDFDLWKGTNYLCLITSVVSIRSRNPTSTRLDTDVGSFAFER